MAASVTTPPGTPMISVDSTLLHRELSEFMHLTYRNVLYTLPKEQQDVTQQPQIKENKYLADDIGWNVLRSFLCSAVSASNCVSDAAAAEGARATKTRKARHKVVRNPCKQE